jgi:hypothetical protein
MKFVFALFFVMLFAAAIGQQDEHISWSRKALSWSHYREQTTGSGSQVAFTYIGIEYSIQDFQGKPAAAFYAIVRPADSWVKTGSATDEQLIHEQGLFDIGELYARKMRKDISMRLRNFTEEVTVTQLLPEIRSVYIQHMNEMLQKIQACNVETAHGKNQKAQQKWNAWIDEELTKLSIFAIGDQGF